VSHHYLNVCRTIPTFWYFLHILLKKKLLFLEGPDGARVWQRSAFGDKGFVVLWQLYKRAVSWMEDLNSILLMNRCLSLEHINLCQTASLLTSSPDAELRFQTEGWLSAVADLATLQ
jgi:hypothetical protein